MSRCIPCPYLSSVSTALLRWNDPLSSSGEVYQRQTYYDQLPLHRRQWANATVPRESTSPCSQVPHPHSTRGGTVHARLKAMLCHSSIIHPTNKVVPHCVLRWMLKVDNNSRERSRTFVIKSLRIPALGIPPVPCNEFIPNESLVIPAVSRRPPWSSSVLVWYWWSCLSQSNK